jgi:hypothetical protein
VIAVNPDLVKIGISHIWIKGSLFIIFLVVTTLDDSDKLNLGYPKRKTLSGWRQMSNLEWLCSFDTCSSCPCLIYELYPPVKRNFCTELFTGTAKVENWAWKYRDWLSIRWIFAWGFIYLFTCNNIHLTAESKNKENAQGW